MDLQPPGMREFWLGKGILPSWARARRVKPGCRSKLSLQTRVPVESSAQSSWNEAGSLKIHPGVIPAGIWEATSAPNPG